jgi:MFS family permease
MARRWGWPPTRSRSFSRPIVVGGALAQWPAGWLADRLTGAACSCGFRWPPSPPARSRWVARGLGISAVFLAAFVFGLATFPIYSISAAHAHDWAEDAQRVELSAALMFFYALGAIFAPLVTSGLIAAYGPGALFWFIASAHLGSSASASGGCGGVPRRISAPLCLDPAHLVPGRAHLPQGPARSLEALTSGLRPLPPGAKPKATRRPGGTGHMARI